jgi:hypothetical protein
LTRARLKLLHLMIAVGAFASFLVLLKALGGFVIICILWALILTVIFWVLLRGQRRRASCGFGIASLGLNCSLAAFSIYALNMWGTVCMFLGSFCGVPGILGFGMAWAVAATHRGTVRRRSPLVAWPLVIVLASLPLTMLLTHWPLYLAFLASKPPLDRLADQIAAGYVPRGPLRCGLFLVVGCAVDPKTGNVGLITNSDPSGRSGFVRVNLATTTQPRPLSGPFYNLNYDLQMSEKWWYQNED